MSGGTLDQDEDKQAVALDINIYIRKVANA